MMQNGHLDRYHDEFLSRSKLILKRALGGLFIATVFAAALASISHVLTGESAANYALNHPTSFAWVPPENINFDFGNGKPQPVDVPPALNRVPSNSKKITIDLFSHPKVRAHIEGPHKNKDIAEACSGPSPNIDFWLNNEAEKADLVNDESYLAFGLDCRLPGTDHLAFLVVLSSKGRVVNATPLIHRAESVSLMNTTTLVASTGEGVFLWDFVNDVLQPGGFLADPHSLVYRQSENKFYGFYPDRMALELHRPNTVCQFDGDTGLTNLDGGAFRGTQEMWSWTNPKTQHFNYVSLSGDSIFLSASGGDCLKKLNMKTNEIEWTLGGHANMFDFTDITGNNMGTKMGDTTFLPWSHQHKFQHLDDQYVSLLDNNINPDQDFIEKPWGKSSRMVVVKIDQEQLTAQTVFSYPMGDRARSYGGTDILPSGNLLGSSYVDWVFPAMEDYQYHQNIWEVSPEGEVVWRVAFKGLNPMEPENFQDPYPHHFQAIGSKNHDTMPSGWNIYNVEKSYPSPVVTRPCIIAWEGSSRLQFIPFNTIRSQEDYPGVAYLVGESSKEQLASAEFYFHKSWLPRPVQFELPDALQSQPVSLVVANHWGDVTVVNFGLVSQLKACSPKDQYRRFYPKYG